MPQRAGIASLEVSLRTAPAGGPVRDAVPEEELEKVRQAVNAGTAKGLVILVHGYNNSLKEADEAFAGFFERQRDIAQLPENRPLADNKVFLELYWPGDADWGIASFLFYMGAIKNAKLSAKGFADMLKALATRLEPLEVQVIGHSLGCRVIFELLRGIANAQNILLTRTVFMAAAVPLFLIESPQDQNRPRYWYDLVLRRSQGQARSLFSPADSVLSLAFPLGQTLAKGDEGFMPVALGHDFWQCSAMPEQFTQYEVAGADHPDYWGWKPRTRRQALDAQLQVHEFLGFNSRIARTTAERGTAQDRSTETRENPQSRAVAFG